VHPPITTLVVELEWWIVQLSPLIPSTYLPMMIFEEEDHMMKDGGLGFRTADIQDDAILEFEEHNFPWLELATRNHNGCPSPS
jgi:hypothetical protein